MAYFEGINEAIHVDRVGVYGTYTTLYNLFENGLVKYGWQQTFGARGKIVDHRAQLHQYKIALPGNGLRVDQWGLTGAGGLDLDRAAHPNFGQWLSTRTTASVTDAEKQATVQAIAMATAGGPCG